MVKLDKRINLLFIAIVSIFFASCESISNKNAEHNFNDFDCLIGNWTNDKDTSALFFENWTKNGNGNYSGISYILANNDTVFFESINITNSDSGAYYSVAVHNQNQAETIHFKLVETENHQFKFENNKHDFPQSINYQYKAPDTLNTWIEGTIKGKPRKESFLMWRKN